MTEREALKNIYEVWAGGEGIPVPETAVEAYLLRLIKQMRDEASKALAECRSSELQEPVAWMFADDYKRMKTSETCCEVYSVKVGNPERGETEIELYTAPPQREWEGLTDEDIARATVVKYADVGYADYEYKEFARAIEAKLKEKNT